MEINGFSVKCHFYYFRNEDWYEIPEDLLTEEGFLYQQDSATYFCRLQGGKDTVLYQMGFDAPYETKLKLELELQEENSYYHLIPCNIFGDNHADEAKPGEFPLLTYAHQDNSFCSPMWEFRADRAATPISALACEKGAVGISIEPYAKSGDAFIHNGLFSGLPERFGVTLGYTNAPVTVINKRTPGEAKGDTAKKAVTEGTVYAFTGHGRLDIHRIIRAEYDKIHERAVFRKTFKEAAKALLDTFVSLNWSEEEKEYTNRKCQPPMTTTLTPWRSVTEIGWTGGAILSYPMVLCRDLLPEFANEAFEKARSGEEIIDRIVAGFNEASGLWYDLTVPDKATGSRVNGWWTYLGLVKDCHCAYNVGSAAHYITKTLCYLKGKNKEINKEWLDSCTKVLGTVISLQREDGAFGYTYSITEKKVTDWSGFAGCWFVPACVYMYRLTEQDKYMDAAKKAMRYYRSFVADLNCYGAPMDTWKSIDQEGNLAFVRGARLLYEDTKDEEFLEMFRIGAEYEYLWRYAYKSRPDHDPLQDGWNSCGGSVTSVSNPHIHPMGVIIDADLRYLAGVTGDSYHESRAYDSSAWLMQTLELYPEKTGYGRYGVLSERWCPSDGLTVEEYSDGRPYSSWFSYNLWAAANALEAVCELCL